MQQDTNKYNLLHDQGNKVFNNRHFTRRVLQETSYMIINVLHAVSNKYTVDLIKSHAHKPF